MSFTTATATAAILLPFFEPFPKVGLYQGETWEDWLNFNQFVDEMFDQVNSPRNLIATQMRADRELVQLLDQLGIQPLGTRLSPPYLVSLVQNLPTSQLLAKQERWQQTIDQLRARLDSLFDKGSPVYQSIQAQLAKSQTTTMADVIEQMQQKLERQQQQAREHSQAIQISPQFAQLQRLSQKYYQQWREVDCKVGETHQHHGDLLESKVDQILTHIKSRGYCFDQYYTNLDWNDNLGEVDLVCLNQGQVVVLIECKAKLFDVMAGYQQNGPPRNPAKTRLKLPSVPAQWLRVDQSTPCLVVTTLPNYSYTLGYESLVQRVITYRVKHPELDLKQVYTYGRDLFKDRQTPADWIRANARHIIILGVPQEV